MPTDHSPDAWGSTYNGFSGAPAGQAPPRTAVRRRRPSTPVLLGAGVAAAAVLGLAFGLASRPTLNTGDGPDRRPMAPAAGVTPGAADLRAAAPAAPEPAAEPSAGQVQIEMDPTLAPPEARVPPAPGKLQVLPRIPRSAPSAPTAPSTTPRGAVSPSPPQLSYVTPPPAVAAPAPLPVPSPRATDDRNASFDCAGAGSRAEQMVCEDPELAAADRRLARAYDRALASGVSPRELRADQRDWLDVREDAARYSRRAVANVYEQRIQELEDLAAR